MSEPEVEQAEEEQTPVKQTKSNRYRIKDTHSIFMGLILIMGGLTWIVLTIAVFSGNPVLGISGMQLLVGISMISIGIDWAWSQIRRKEEVELARILPAIALVVTGGFMLSALVLAFAIAFFIPR